VTHNALPDYERPPVIEVAAGITYKTIDRLLAPYLGLLWERFKPDYPKCREMPPLIPQVETFGPGAPIETSLLEVPPLPRIWFLDEKENRVIQVQRDRFLHNWKKVEAEDEYPRFPTLRQMFRERLSDFQAFLAANGLGELRPVQYELTYVNHIPKGDGWNSLQDIGRVLPDFSWDFHRGRFLPEPEAVNWRTVFRLPEDCGRLHVSVRSVSRLSDQTPVLLLDLTARGIGQDRSLAAMWSWFDTARTWIVRTFADIADDHVQKEIWRRKQ